MILAAISLDRSISIHAPTRGATIYPCRSRTILAISIHAPTRGATRKELRKKLLLVFQSTLLQEERLNAVRQVANAVKFQSTLLQEERHDSKSVDVLSFSISIHAPTRGATAKMHNNPYTYL